MTIIISFLVWVLDVVIRVIGCGSIVLMSMCTDILSLLGVEATTSMCDTDGGEIMHIDSDGIHLEDGQDDFI